jgi:hypothetical protein
MKIDVQRLPKPSLMSMSPDAFIEEFSERLARTSVCNLVLVELSAPNRSTVSVDLIEVTPTERRKHIGSRVLTQLSDEGGVLLEVIPHSFEGHMGDDELAAWYERRGFVFTPTHDSPRLMRRAPKTSTSS